LRDEERFEEAIEVFKISKHTTLSSKSFIKSFQIVCANGAERKGT
jgi:hypothetical protein